MSIFDKAKAKAEELFGRAEQLYGESHGDAAARVDGEAHRLEAEALEDRAHEAGPDRPVSPEDGDPATR